jgi:Kef-type K+ transport system membrane component KefB
VLPGDFVHLFRNDGGSSVALDGLISLGSIFLLFVVGLEIDMDQIKAQKKAVAWLGLLGLVIPYAIGYATGWTIHGFYETVSRQSVLALVLGAALAISALPVIARVLIDLGLLKTPFGSLVIAIATVNDVIGWLLFTVALGIAGNTEQHFPLAVIIITTLGLVVSSVTLLPKLVGAILRFIQRIFPGDGSVMGIAVVLMVLASAGTEYLGVRQANVLPHAVEQSLFRITMDVLAPMFFAAVGLRINFINSFDWRLVSIILLAAYSSKLLAAVVGARFARIDRRSALAVGLGITARGGMGIILAAVALDAALIGPAMFEALVIMAVITSATTVFIRNLLPPQSAEPQPISQPISVLNDTA